MQFVDAFQKRRNITFFSNDIPEKLIIKEILQQAYQYVPVLQCVYPFRIKIFGPEYTEEKKELVLRSVCGPDQHKWSLGGEHYGQWDRLKEIYEQWLELNNQKGENRLFENVFFNNQCTAPYLIKYEPVPNLPTQTQLDQGYIERRGHTVGDGLQPNMRDYAVSMHSYGVSLLAVDKGLDASFTRYFIQDENPPLLLQNTNNNTHPYYRVPFFLGIGYQSHIPYKGDANRGIKPGFDELHTWM